jgi:Tfp pilus assembly protein PilF
MGTNRRDRVCVLLVALLASLSVQMVMAATGGRVKGSVTDENGLPVADVKITLTSEATNFLDTTTTDKKGKFAYYFVDATEPYNLRFEKEGHQTTDVPLRPQVGGNLRLSVEVPTDMSSSKGGELVSQPVLSAGAEAFNLGVNAARAGDLEAAEEKFSEAIRKEPDLVAPYAALASLHQESGENDKAVEFAEMALARESDNARALMVLYDVYSALGEKERAETYLERVRDAGGGMEAAIRVYNVGAQSYRAGDIDTATMRFREALQIEPVFAAPHAALATIYLSKGENQNALDEANAALAEEPDNKGALRTKFNAEHALGDETAAAQTLARMAESDSAGTADAFFTRGSQAFEAGQIEVAMEALIQAVELDPTHASAHYTLGLCYINSGDAAKAKNHLQIFLDLDPEHPEAPNAREMLKYAS